ncbi:hypothetical protein LC087_11955 [Bacillus carboniphilus]|uniref:Lipoprotein n=1 Tax=Bacillus carboniphilus TaxID=86663 RepID=A0ABY9JS06_9BACI|nr:hypothetical protein [Bacillus carboniphilus]WLR41594.1 hypothetical protein LC087_11955 [Bacillus carboniphilus]
MISRKWLFVLVAMVLVTTACSNDSEQAEKKTTQDSEQSKEGAVTKKEDKQEEESISSEDEQKEEEEAKKEEETDEQGIDYRSFRPQKWVVKTFENQDGTIRTETIVDINDEYVQELVELGSSATTKIYRWTENEVTLVYEENGLDTVESILDNFKLIEVSEPILGKNASWELTSENETVTTPIGDYDEVILVQKESEEVVGEMTTYKQYYASEMGVVKYIYDQTGEQGFTEEFILTDVK